MSFTIGQKIVFLHEKGGGVVLKLLEKGNFLVEDADGFERICLKTEIAPLYSEDYKIDEDSVRGINADESFSTGKRFERKGILTGSRKAVDVWELDLHIENLTDSHSGWSNTDIVRKQLMELKSFYNRARARQIRKLVVIHGVGTGVLREEVRMFFHGKDGVEYFDADFREYGKGATAVEIRYNL